MTEHRIDLSKLARVRDGSGHSIFGASGSGMFLNCTGSLIPNLLVEDLGNEDAAYGTIAHGVAEEWLRSGERPDHLVGEIQEKDGFKIEIDDDMLSFVRECIDRCEWEPGDHVVELRVDYSDLTPIPNQGGTMDFAAMRYGYAKVKDHKFGKHKQVFAKKNTQLMLYAYGLFLEWDWLYDFQVFELEILQPRLDHFDTWTCTREELLAFAAWAKKQMHEAWSLDAPRTPGEQQCEYCKIRTSCAANARMQARLCEGIFGDETATIEELEQFKERLEDDFDPFSLTLVSVGNLTTSHIAELWKHSRAAMKFWNSLGAELFNRAKKGEPVERVGLKLVHGKSNRAFIDEKKAAAHLEETGVSRDDIFETKIISPAKAEKALRKAGHRPKDIPDLLEGYVHKPPGKVTLVSIHDPRPAIVNVDDTTVFDDESTPETEDI